MITRAPSRAQSYAAGVNRPWWIAVVRLTVLLAAGGLAVSRTGLILHELAGHGGAAVAVGGTVTDAQLFWFAGGWIRYQVPDLTVVKDLTITLGGIAVEIALGIALWVGLRRPAGLGARILRTIGATLLVHAMFYLATGTWHGYGDGRLIHALAGDARYPIAITAGLVACAMAWSGARGLFGALVAAVPPPRLGGAILAIAVAGLANLGLDLGELRLRRDATYAVTMQSERERVVARELAAWQRAQPAAISDAERESRARALLREHREFPFVRLLGAGLAVAVVAGATRSPRGSERPVARWAVAIACGAAVISTLAVIAIDAAFH